jgi:hypothetical protein
MMQHTFSCLAAWGVLQTSKAGGGALDEGSGPGRHGCCQLGRGEGG